MRKKKGQALLETALILPILLIILCAVVDFGRILYASTQLNLVSQEAVRQAGLGADDSDVIQFVMDNTLLPDKDTMTVNITPSDIDRKSGDYVTLEITYNLNYITPLMNVFLPSPYKVDVKSTMRVE